MRGVSLGDAPNAIHMNAKIEIIKSQFLALASKHPSQAIKVRLANHRLAPVASATPEVVKAFWLMMVSELRQAVK